MVNYLIFFIIYLNCELFENNKHSVLKTSAITIVFFCIIIIIIIIIAYQIALILLKVLVSVLGIGKSPKGSTQCLP